MTTLLQALLIVAAAALALTLATHYSVLRVARRKRENSSFPGISIFKPLKGLEDDLYDNLVSIVRQDYPCFEVIFGIADASDPALLVARKVQRDFPGVRIKLVTHADEVGLNPKVNNLIMMSRHSAYDCVLISDSNVRAPKGYLRAMAAELEATGVGLVSSVLVGSGERNLGAHLDNLHMNSFVVRAICGAEILASHPCVIGKSMLLRLSELGRIGGFESVRDVLAEDYVLGRRYALAGYKVVLSPHPLQALSTRRSVKEFMARHVRWGQMRRRLTPYLYFAEPLLNPVPLLLAGLVASLIGVLTETAASANLALLFAGGLALRLASDAALHRLLRGKPLRVRDFAWLVVKDLLVVAIWSIAAVKRSVSWRGTRMTIGPGSVLHALESPQQRAETFALP